MADKKGLFSMKKSKKAPQSQSSSNLTTILRPPPVLRREATADKGIILTDNFYLDWGKITELVSWSGDPNETFELTARIGKG